MPCTPSTTIASFFIFILYAIQLGEINHSPFSTELKMSISNSIQYLSHLIDPATGEMPVYGSNDGALVLPLNNCDFTDYRPLLQLGSVITAGVPMFEPGEWDEDVFWICGMDTLPKRERVSCPRRRGEGKSSNILSPRRSLHLAQHKLPRHPALHRLHLTPIPRRPTPYGFVDGRTQYRH